MRRAVAALFLFGISFGYVEAAVVVYLRAIYDPTNTRAAAFELKHPNVQKYYLTLSRDFPYTLRIGGSICTPGPVAALRLQDQPS